ncbi:MAG TPA: hypothetical protein VKB61_07345 [Candidatus Acidoferrum sp.]|nr:hypothetical protein [Candidatus Acidoferrum sp.]
MKRLIGVLVGALAVLVSGSVIAAQDLLVPAGTLLQCTMDEPNFSSKTAAIGDPVVCHLRTMQEFGKPVFPRGSMLGGHLEADKEPGHFVGKGYLKITFDRVILPNGDLPVPAKVIQARGYKVDKEGDIDGKGHAKRDVVEWMLPPLWPWKVVALPMRGPRPTLKGEEPLELRLMDDIVIPRTLAYGPAANSNRPPWASSKKPSAMNEAQPGSVEPAVEKSVRATLSEPTPAGGGEPVARVTNLVLKSNAIYEVSKYRVNGDVLEFVELNGTTGAVDVNDVDWRKTTEMTSRVRSVDPPVLARQTN